MKIFHIIFFTFFHYLLHADEDLNFFKSQHNLGVTHGQYGINYRIYFDDNASEVEFKYKPIKNLQAHIKIAEDDLLQENRYRLTHTIGKFLTLNFHIESNSDILKVTKMTIGDTD